MKRFAVAFIYQQIPQFDRVVADEDSHRYYKGNVEVLRIYNIDSPFVPITELGLALVDADDEKEATQKVIDTHFYRVVTARAQEVPND